MLTLLLAAMGSLMLGFAVHGLRTHRLKERYVLMMVVTAVPFFILAVWPTFIGRAAHYLGVEYQTLIEIGIVCYLLVSNYQFMTLVSQQDAKIARLAERVGIAVPTAATGTPALSADRFWPKFCIAHVSAFLVAALAYACVSSSSATPTTIIGYSAFMSFPIGKFIAGIYIPGLLFPALGMLFTTIAVQRPDAPWRQPSPAQPLPDLAPGAVDLAGWAALTFGVLFSSASFYARPDASMAPWFGALVGIGIGAALGAAGRRHPRPVANALLCAAILSPFSLAFLSGATALHLPDRYKSVPWFSFGIAAAASALVLALAARDMKPNAVAARLRPLMRYFVAPLAVFVSSAALVGAESAPIDWFHDGEALGSTFRLLSGELPYRDFLFVHGAYADLMRALVGMGIWGKSVWAYRAGEDLVLNPLFWVTHYCLWGTVLQSTLLGLTATLFLPLIMPEPFGWAYPRLLLLPVVLLLVLAGLRPGRLRVLAAAAGCLVLFVAVVPEALPLIALLCAAVGLLDWSEARFSNLRFRYARSVVFTGLVVGACLSALAVLAMAGGLRPLMSLGTTFADHRYVAGIPLSIPLTPANVLAALMPFVSGWLLLWSTWWRRRASGRFTAEDVCVGVAAMFGFFYYIKFSHRADMHLVEAFVGAMPASIFVIGRAFRSMRDRVVSRADCAWLPVLIRGLAVSALACALPEALALRPRLRPSARAIASSRVAYRLDGFAENDAERESKALSEAHWDDVQADMQRFVDRVLEPGDALFDFANQPALFQFLLERKPATRWTYMVMAVTRNAQESVVRDLQSSRPKLVVFQADTPAGLSHWDSIPNVVRFYAVGPYLLSHYVPLGWLDGFFFLRRADFKVDTDALTNLPLRSPFTPASDFSGAEPCDFGDALENVGEHIVKPGLIKRSVAALASDAGAVTVDFGDVTGGVGEAFLRLRLQGEGRTRVTLEANGTLVAEFNTLLSPSRKGYWLPVGSCPRFREMLTPPHSLFSVRAPETLRVVDAELYADEL